MVDFYAEVVALLRADGYQVYEADPEQTEYGFWFTWAKPGAGIEVGDTLASEEAAWVDALRHRLENSSIPLG